MVEADLLNHRIQEALRVAEGGIQFGSLIAGRHTRARRAYRYRVDIRLDGTEMLSVDGQEAASSSCFTRRQHGIAYMLRRAALRSL